MNNSKAIGAVVATALFLVVAVVAVIIFQTWFNQFSSTIQNEVETESSGTNTQINRVVGDQLFFEKKGNSNLSINRVEVDGVDCNVSTTITNDGMQRLDLKTCTENLTSSSYDAVVYTDDGVYTEKFFYEPGSLSDFNSQEGYPSNAFVSLWNVSIDSGSSGLRNIELPLKSGGTYNFTVDWGDGSNDTITSYNQAEVTHSYSDNGTYILEITGTIDGFGFDAGGPNDDDNDDGDKLIDVKQWGTLKLSDAGGEQFSNAENLVNFSASDSPNLTGITDISEIFKRATSFNGNVNNWDVSNITNMQGIFQHATSYNQPLDQWNVSKVNNMHTAFYNAESFNQSLSNWDVSNVNSMRAMFRLTDSFNQPLNNWNVSNVTTMRYMFLDSIEFNQPLNNWDVSNVTTMNAMFLGASNFNQSLSNWNVSNVTDMRRMFQDTVLFNQNISSWCVEQIGSKPTDFDLNAGFDGENTLQPNWGQTC